MSDFSHRVDIVFAPPLPWHQEMRWLIMQARKKFGGLVEIEDILSIAAEKYVKIVFQGDRKFESPAHFFSFMEKCLRNDIVNHISNENKQIHIFKIEKDIPQIEFFSIRDVQKNPEEAYSRLLELVKTKAQKRLAEDWLIKGMWTDQIAKEYEISRYTAKKRMERLVTILVNDSCSRYR